MRPTLKFFDDREIERITEDAIIMADGRTREVDTLILATGFEATKYLSAFEVVGRGGLGINEAWPDGAQACKGVVARREKREPEFSDSQP